MEPAAGAHSLTCPNNLLKCIIALSANCKRGSLNIADFNLVMYIWWHACLSQVRANWLLYFNCLRHFRVKNEIFRMSDNEITVESIPQR